MSTWVGLGPVIGPGSLDGFAIGVMMSGACFLAVTAPRRARRRQAAAAGTVGALAAAPREWLSRRARVPRLSSTPSVPGISWARAFEPGAFEPGALEPGAFDGGGFEPGAFEAGGFGPGPFGAGAFSPAAERLARPEDEPGVLNDADWASSGEDAGWAPSVGDDGRAPGGHRNRHRLNEPIPGSTSPERTPRGGMSRDGGPYGGTAADGPHGAPHASTGFPDRVFPDSGFPDVAFPDEAPDVSIPLQPLPDMAQHDREDPQPPRDRSRLEPPFPDWEAPDDWEEQDPAPFPSGASRERGRPDLELPDIAFPDGTFGTSKRPDARRLPRHAAPAVGLGRKVSRWVTGVFARPLASGAHS